MAKQVQVQGPTSAVQSGQDIKRYPWGCLSVSLLAITAISVGAGFWIWNAFNFSILSMAEKVELLTLFVTVYGCVILVFFFGLAGLIATAPLPHPLQQNLDTVDRWIWNHLKPLRPLIRFLQRAIPLFGKKHFCISYHILDRPWAKWISLQLEQAGHSTTLRDWDGGNLEDEIQKANRRGKHTITVLSPDYLLALKTKKSGRGQRSGQENKNIPLFKRWNLPEQRGIPVLVHESKLEGLLAEIQPIDLVRLPEDTARERLLRDLPIKPNPQYKLSMSADEIKKVVFPGNFPYIKYLKRYRNPLFTGRCAFLEDLYCKFREVKMQAVYGLKGMGKTQTVLEYAYRYGGYYHAIIWLDASLQDIFEADCQAAVQVIQAATDNNVQEQDNTQKQVVQTGTESIPWLKTWLENHSDWLVILDRCDDLNLLQTIIPIDAKGHVLLTMEGRPIQQVQSIIPVELCGMEDYEGAEFLLRLIDPSYDLASIRKVASDYDFAMKISKAMGGLPLGILHAGAYIATTNDLAGYLDLYKNRRSELLRERPNFVFLEPEFQTIATTWSISFAKLQRIDAGAGELLQFCAYLAPDPIPEEIIRKAPRLGPTLRAIVADDMRFNDAIRSLRLFSLVDRSTSQINGETRPNLVVHPLVQDVIREGVYDGATVDSTQQRTYAERALLAVEHTFIKAVFPNVEHDKWELSDVKYDKWELCQRYLPHALTCVKYIEQWGFESKEAQLLLYVTGRYLSTQGEYAQARPLLEQALLLSSKFLEQYADKDWETYRKTVADLTIYLDALAELYHAQTLYERAEPLYQLALSIKLNDPKRRHLHPDTAASLNNLGRLYDDWGQYYHQLEAIMGKFYSDWGNYYQDRIEALYRKALDIRRRTLGLAAPDVAASYNNLASYYQKQGDLYLLNGDNDEANKKYITAKEYYRYALEIWERALSHGHPDIILGRANVASIELALGNKAKAEVDLLNAIEITKKYLGPDHPKVAGRLNNLAELYRRRNNERRPLSFWKRRSRMWFNRAEESYQQAYTIYRKKFEPGHPDIETVVHNYAMLLREEDSIENKPKQRDYVKLARKKLEKYASEKDQYNS